MFHRFASLTGQSQSRSNRVRSHGSASVTRAGACACPQASEQNGGRIVHAVQPIATLTVVPEGASRYKQDDLQGFLFISTMSLVSAPSGMPLSLETAVTELSLAIGQLLRRVRAESNPDELTWSQTVALARLDRAGAMTTADLARAESVKPQSMGATLAELEREGLVERRPHPTDGRQVLFALTDEGVEARRKRSAAKQKWLLAAMAKLDPAEQQTLMSAVALIKRLGEADS